jgi:hypothetical protein
MGEFLSLHSGYVLQLIVSDHYPSHGPVLDPLVPTYCVFIHLLLSLFIYSEDYFLVSF